MELSSSPQRCRRSPATRPGRSPGPSGPWSSGRRRSPGTRWSPAPGGRPGLAGDHRCAEVDALGRGPADRGEQAGRGGRDRQVIPSKPRRRFGCSAHASPRKAGGPRDGPERGQHCGHGDRGELDPGQRERQARARPPVRVSTRSPPSSGIVAPNSARAPKPGSARPYPTLGGVRDDDGGDEHDQRLGKPAEPLPLPPDQRLQPHALAPPGQTWPPLDRAALDHDVAGQTDVEGEERPGDAR